MELDYSIIYSARRKKLTITVERDKSVIVRAPEGTSQQKIKHIIESKKQWLFEKIRHHKKYIDLPHPPKKELVDGESMPYLGRNYRIQIVNLSKDTGICFDQKFLIPGKQLRKNNSLFREWYLMKAKEKIPPRVFKYANILGVEFNKAKISSSKYRWGSCTPNNNININWRLIKAPMFVIDYVIVHELSHLIEPNHTPRFWNIVNTNITNMEKAKRWLKENGNLLEQDL